ncbi:MAG TPA: MurR/RpiR family transcriptional regulator [Anaerolineales bacterium]|nr:MurR/RpiR family transcriptional regulator [Anaerolineales bacterium]
MNVETRNSIDFGQIISENYKSLTKSEKQIADYLRRNQEESAFLSAGELANRLDLSEATLVRFARSLGFDSYPAMREVLQENFRRRVTHSARLRSRLDELREAGDIFERLVVSEMDYMTQSLESVNREALHQAIELMENRKRIYIFGVGPSVSLVELMRIRLERFGHQVIPLTTAGREFLEPLVSMTQQDLLFVICFFDVSPSLQLLLDYARDMHCPVIMLTDTLGSIIGDKATVVLSAKRGPVSGFHSLVVPMTIINSLLLAIGGEESGVMENLDKLDQLRERFKKYSNSST